MRTLRMLCATTLISEFFVIGFAGLVAMKSDLSMATVWTVSGIAMGLCVLLCGMLRWPWALQVGWVLQFGLVLSGFVVPVMFFLGAVFAGLWWASIHYGRHIDEAKVRFAAMDAAAEAKAAAEAQAASESESEVEAEAEARAGAATGRSAADGTPEGGPAGDGPAGGGTVRGGTVGAGPAGDGAPRAASDSA
ncbi:hypothetical protein FHS42_001940 [Streptomyces zagrosensis]|uniref:DUF4233 domain-containing protein n=1 Tax=Streptomyces zagrosensis TaxID=1042984 RepID=A0A7W9UXI0_9ACTN|nr:hypothetical protein [Streptomyces zagrosensis]